MARKAPNPQPAASEAGRRIATPNPDLFVLKTSERYGKLPVSAQERASRVVSRMAKAIAKPGLNREHLFQSATGRPVYVYFAYSGNPALLVREDQAGHQTIGRLTGGRFRPAKAV